MSWSYSRGANYIETPYQGPSILGHVTAQETPIYLLEREYKGYPPRRRYNLRQTFPRY